VHCTASALGNVLEVTAYRHRQETDCSNGSMKFDGKVSRVYIPGFSFKAKLTLALQSYITYLFCSFRQFIACQSHSPYD
jgi:hypothetical protein